MFSTCKQRIETLVSVAKRGLPPLPPVNMRGIQKVLSQILKNTLFMKFAKLFFYIVSIQFITLQFNWMETM